MVAHFEKQGLVENKFKILQYYYVQRLSLHSMTKKYCMEMTDHESALEQQSAYWRDAKNVKMKK